MCGRYYIAIEEKELQDIMREVQSKVDAAHVAEMKTGEIFPTNIAPVITKEGPVLMRWGFRKFDGKGQIINAKSETILEKPTFRKPFLEGQRCIIPGSHYFEWKTPAEGKKIKHAIYDPTSPIIYMAGLYRLEKESGLPVFVIMTKKADENLAVIHDRMPVIASRERALAWVKGADLSGQIPLDYRIA